MSRRQTWVIWATPPHTPQANPIGATEGRKRLSRYPQTPEPSAGIQDCQPVCPWVGNVASNAKRCCPSRRRIHTKSHKLATKPAGRPLNAHTRSAMTNEIALCHVPRAVGGHPKVACQCEALHFYVRASPQHGVLRSSAPEAPGRMRPNECLHNNAHCFGQGQPDCGAGAPFRLVDTSPNAPTEEPPKSWERLQDLHRKGPTLKPGGRSVSPMRLDIEHRPAQTNLR